MNIEKQIREDHHAQLTVQVEADRLEGIKRRAASRLARRVKIPGFRPGKAPYPVIVRHLGEAAILEEAIELLVAEIYPEVIKETGINPYGPGKLENVSATEPLTLEFSVPLKAEAILGDYHSIKIAYELEQVTDQDVNDVLEDLRERHAIIEPVDRAAQVGDLVTMKLRATGLAADAEPAVELIPERSSSVIIRPEDASSKPGAWPFPGFSHHLIGMRAGDEKLLEYTFPEDSLYEALRGVQAQFYVKIEAVKSRQLPELDDDFAKTVGEYDTLEALKADIRESLEEQARTAYHKVYDEKILDAAIEQTTFKYPPEMVDDEVDTLINELQQRLERQGMDIDLYLKSRGIDMKAFREEVRPIAEDRIKRALFLVEFGKAEKVEVKPEELEQEAYSTMDFLYNTLPERDARKLSRREVYTNIVGNVLADMLSDRSLERFREICSDGLSKVEAERSEQTQAEVSISPDVADETETEPSSADNTVVEGSGLQPEETDG